MLQFAPIPPKKMLRQVLSERKTWFALAQEMDVELIHIMQQRPPDVTLILDNGAYEGEFNKDKYATCITTYCPNIVVLPDILNGDWKKSSDLSLNFLEAYNADGPEWMYVPQAEPGDISGWLESLLRATKDKRITWIGLPRCMCTHTFHYPVARIAYANFISNSWPYLKIHALGMVNGFVPELPFLAAAGVRSVDSSCPFNASNIDRWEDKIKEIDNACQNLPML